MKYYNFINIIKENLANLSQTSKVVAKKIIDIDTYFNLSKNEFDISIDLINHSIEDFLNNLKLENLTTISTIILVKNQENYIGNVIKHISELADEIVVVDTGSTDNTISVVESLNKSNVILSEDKWVEDYSLMRNKQLSKASGEWIFFLDSDEILQPISDKNYLKQLLTLIDYLSPDNPVALSIKSYAPKTEMFFEPLRLLRQKDETKFTGLVHETIVSNNKLLSEIETNISVTNYGLSSSEIQKFDKEKRYTNLLLKNIKLDDKLDIRSLSQIDPHALANSKEKYSYKAMLEKSLSIDTSQPVSLINIKHSKYDIFLIHRYAQMQLEDDDLSGTLRTIHTGLKLKPDYIPFILLKYQAILLENHKKLRENLQYLFLDYLSLPSDAADTSHVSPQVLEALIGEYYFSIGEFDNFENVYEKITDESARQIIHPLYKKFENNEVK
ncbi:glycosyltransferase [Leuconostoc pseudomesenteroides]|uniref:glycosyltransferase n=1 Tax=Leuconostoc pseudomesenteroides TaxID=33968 RepID=UPI00403D92AB